MGAPKAKAHLRFRKFNARLWHESISEGIHKPTYPLSVNYHVCKEPLTQTHNQRTDDPYRSPKSHHHHSGCSNPLSKHTQQNINALASLARVCVHYSSGFWPPFSLYSCLFFLLFPSAHFPFGRLSFSLSLFLSTCASGDLSSAQEVGSKDHLYILTALLVTKWGSGTEEIEMAKFGAESRAFSSGKVCMAVFVFPVCWATFHDGKIRRREIKISERGCKIVMTRLVRANLSIFLYEL